MNPNPNTAMIFDLARALAASISKQLEPFDGENSLSDDSCDDLDATMIILDLCSRALISDDRDLSCDILIESFRDDSPESLNDRAPNTFDPISGVSFHDLLDMIPYRTDDPKLMHFFPTNG